MKENAISAASAMGERVTSIDFFRGFTMFLLMGESTRLYSHLLSIHSDFTQFLGTQLSHHAWHGLHFWDLIQPFFMFIMGVAIPFAMANRQKKGALDREILTHALKRSFLLLFLDYRGYHEKHCRVGLPMVPVLLAI